ncbi:MAG TPA: NADH-quinone oxidoreductase subunit F, partial [Dehalococcoidia bacterium]|nr:NADH-quinone oxidoreductase subunit F [Dehalococcoidia bacterium]
IEETFRARDVQHVDRHEDVEEGLRRVIGRIADGAGDLSEAGLALRQMEDYGFLGENILGSGFNFHIKIKEGAGAFVCGEETALIASVEGKRGMPRARPPFPAQSGLWGNPTVINNVKTLANVSVIINRGATWYASIGSEKSKGTAVFALTGKVANSGLVEVPMGIKLEELIYRIGGGIRGGKRFKAVQIGGPSGGCLPASMLKLPVDYESLTAAGSMMGSGGMVVADEDTCMVDLARYFLSFTQAESCGKCPPCRVGTKQMLSILTRLTQGNGRPGDIEQLERIATTVKQGSLCGLGQTAPNPVLTTIRYFRNEYEAHINERRCPALVCKDLVSFYILPDKCQGCMICLRNCPTQAIAGGKRLIHVIDQSKCVKCGICIDVCPPRFAAIVKVSGEQIEVPSQPVPVETSA